MSVKNDFFSLRNSKKYFNNRIFNEYFSIIDFYSYHLGLPRTKVLRYFPKFNAYFYNKCKRLANAIIKVTFFQKNITLDPNEIEDLYLNLSLEIYQLINTYNRKISKNFFGYATSKASKVVLDFINKKQRITYESDVLLDTEDDEQFELDGLYTYITNTAKNPALLVQHPSEDDTKPNSKYQNKIINFIFDYYTSNYPSLSYFFVYFIKPDSNTISKIRNIIKDDKIREVETIIRNTGFNKFYYASKYLWFKDFVKTI